MSPRGAAIIELLRTTFATIDTLDPTEADIVYAALLSTMRARRPKSVSPLTLGTPTEPIRDPRAA